MTIQDLQREILECNKCPLLEYNNEKILGTGEKYRIMLVEFAPTLRERNSHLLKNLLSKVELREDDYYLTSVCKTKINKGILLTEDQIDHCMKHLIAEIVLIKPQVILIFGKEARQAFALRFPEESRKREFYLENEKHKTVLFPVTDPKILFFQPEYEKKIVKQLLKAKTFYKRNLI